jgi:hypothetical protein
LLPLEEEHPQVFPLDPLPDLVDDDHPSSSQRGAGGAPHSGLGGGPHESTLGGGCS